MHRSPLLLLGVLTACAGLPPAPPPESTVIVSPVPAPRNLLPLDSVLPAQVRRAEAAFLGVALDARTTQPCTGTVKATPADSTSTVPGVEGSFDPSGAFALGPLPPGEYWVEAACPPLLPARHRVTLQAGQPETLLVVLRPVPKKERR